MLHSPAHAAAGVHPPPTVGLQLVRLRGHGEPEAGSHVAQPTVPRLQAPRRDAPATAPARAMELAEFHALVSVQLRVSAGHQAFLQGQPLKDLLGVRSGSFKTAIVQRDGREQVNRFSFAGDLMGLDGLAAAVHGSTATALEDSIVCVVPLTSLRDAASCGQPWHEVLCYEMSQEIVRAQARMLLLGSTGALGRLATFLLEVSDSMRLRGYSPLEYRMRMSRVDIASYLGLSMETVSRMFSTLQQQGVVEVERRHIVIRSLARLRDLRNRSGS